MNISQPRMRFGGLESVVAPMPFGPEVWRDGVTPTFQCTVDGGRAGCGTIVIDDKQVAEKKPFQIDGTFDSQYPAFIWATTGCNIGGTSTVIGDVIAQQGEIALDRIRWNQVADLLYNGNVGRAKPNYSFLWNALIPAGFEASNPSGIVPTLQGMFESLNGIDARDQRGVLHVPLQYLPYFLELHLLEIRDGGYWMGMNTQVSFDEYVNLGPRNILFPGGYLLSFNSVADTLTITSVYSQVFPAGSAGPIARVYSSDGTTVSLSVPVVVLSPSSIRIDNVSTIDGGVGISRIDLLNAAGTVVVASIEATIITSGANESTTATDTLPLTPEADEFWMYLTDQPLVDFDTVQVDATKDVRLNRAEVRAEQPVIALLDPCLIVGAKANVYL